MITILSRILKGEISVRCPSSEQVSAKESKKLNLKLQALIKAFENETSIILGRGDQKRRLANRFNKNLNSSDDLYQSLFLIGEKAKNYLMKEVPVGHPLTNIFANDAKVCEWIFTEYSKINNFDKFDIDYFKNIKNKHTFSLALKGNLELIDYYLFGLHTSNSDLLVNFVSSTTSLEVGDSHNNDLLIIFWINEQTKKLSMSKDRLTNMRPEILSRRLPVLRDSFYPNEHEFSIKGCILPHYIFGVYDIENTEFIINPECIKPKRHWIKHGFDINQTSFSKFIKTTQYKRCLEFTEYEIGYERSV